MIRQLGYITFASIFGKALGFVNFIFIIKYLEPVEFSNFAVILSVSSILLPIISMSYDSYLPALKEEEVKNVVSGYIFNSILICLAVFVLMFLLSVSNIYFYSVLFSFATIIQNTTINYNLAVKKLRYQINIILYFSALTEIIKFIFIIYYDDGNSLIIGSIVGYTFSILLSLLTLKFSNILNFYNNIKTKRVTNYLSSKFFSIFIQNLSLQLVPIFIYNQYHGDLSAKYYMALSISTVLFQILGRRLSDTFIREIKNGLNIKKMSVNITIFIFIISSFYHLLILVALTFFNSSLPENWSGLVEFYAPCAIYSFFQLCSYPIQQLPLAFNKNKFFIFDSITRLLIVFCLITLVYFYNISITLFIYAYSGILSFLFILIYIRNMKWII